MICRKLSSDVTATTSQIRLNGEETLTLAKTVNDHASKAVANTEQLFPQLEKIDQTIASSSQRIEQVMSELIEAQAATLLKNIDVKALESNLLQQVSTQLSSNTEMIVQNFQHLSLQPEATASASHNIGNDRLTSDLSGPASQRVTYSTSPQYREDSQHSYVGLRNNVNCAIKADTLVSARCTCRTVNRTRRWQLLSILLVTRAFRTQHFSYCPEYNVSEQSLELTMQLLPPFWFMSRTIDFGVHVKNWWTMKPTSICPIMIGTSRLVDSRTSPAFRAIASAQDEIYDTELHHVCIPRLQQTLQDLFDQQKASPLDTDCNGHTLLNVRECMLRNVDHQS